MPTFDVVLHTNLGMFAPNYQQLAGTDPPVTDRVQAVSGLYIERLDLELAKAIMDTCEPKHRTGLVSRAFCGFCNRRGVAIRARRVCFALDLLAAAQAVGRRGVWLQALRRLLGALDEEGLLKWDETFLDGSFAPAKKGVLRSAKPSGARGRSGWYWSTVKVFRWEFGWKVPPPVKLRLRKPRSPKSGYHVDKAARGKSLSA